ncbi:MAG: hypothetical protein WCO13_00865 [Bacteroidota bacterium]
MKTRILMSLLFLLMLVEIIPLQAQNDTEFKHALGVAAGFTTGYGLSYRYLPTKFGAQATFAPYVDNEREIFSIGITFLYTIVKAENLNLYLYQGNQYYYNKKKLSKPVEVNKYFNNGIGIGIEFTFQKRFGFNIMGGYAGYEDFNKINFTGETALFFKF